MSQGKLTTNGVHLRDHEYNTIKVLLDNGHDIELIPPSQIHGLPMPDFMMGGVPWEMKSPEGSGKKTIENTMKKAARQSGHVVIDLRRIGLPEEQALHQFEREFNKSKRIKQMKIITIDLVILDFPSKSV